MLLKILFLSFCRTHCGSLSVIFNFLHYASDSIKFDDRPMLDKLHRLEKLGYLDSMEQWHIIRSVRNSFAHDYPQDDDLKVAYLNQAIDAEPIFENILAKVRLLLLV